MVEKLQVTKGPHHVSLGYAQDDYCHRRSFIVRRQEGVKLVDFQNVVPYPSIPPVGKIFRKGVSVSPPVGGKGEEDSSNVCWHVRAGFVGFKVGASCCVRVSARDVVLCSSVMPSLNAGQLINVQAKGNDGDDRRLRDQYQT